MDVTFLLDERNIDISLIQSCFTPPAWDVVKKLYAERLELPWKCGMCNDDLATSSSVGCDSCLGWYHISCLKLKRAPKSKLWFCLSCSNK